MIDFRYHIVSLAAVFLALAVGIVLGAGPLRDELSSTLDDQVQELRDERAGLRAQLDAAVGREEAKDGLIEAVSPALTTERLAGTRAALVLMPDADANLADSATQSLTDAGAEVVSTTTVTPDVEDADTAAARRQLAAELADRVADPPPRTGTDPTVQTLIAAVVTAADEPGQVDRWPEVQVRLDEVGLIETTWNEDPRDPPGPSLRDRRPPDVVVVVTGADPAAPADPEAATRAELRTDLVAAFAATDVPTLLLGSGTETYADPEEQAQSPLISAVRAEAQLREVVSTVDNGEGALGRLALVLSVAELLDGQVGHYGLGADAVGPGPEVVPVPPALGPPDTSTNSPSTSTTSTLDTASTTTATPPPSRSTIQTTPAAP